MEKSFYETHNLCIIVDPISSIGKILLLWKFKKKLLLWP